MGGTRWEGVVSDDYQVIFTTSTEDGTKEIEVGFFQKTLELAVNRKRVVVRERLDLTFWQKAGAITAVISAATGGFYALLQIIDWFQ